MNVETLPDSALATSLDRDTMTRAVERLGAAADAAEAATHPGFFSGLAQKAGTFILGDSSTVEAADSDAIATRRAYDTMRAKLPRLLDRQDLTHGEAVDFVRSASGMANVSALVEAMQLQQPSRIAATVAADTVADIKDAAKLGLPIAGLLVAGAVALFLFARFGGRSS